jgi:hypothetical protein
MRVNEAKALRLAIHYGKLVVDDGRTFMVPLDLYPRLAHATPELQRNWILLGDGYSIHWPDLDEDIGVEGLLVGNRSAENRKSFERWLSSRKPPR